jgi:imidazolonepropionase-like amidohydrolase
MTAAGATLESGDVLLRGRRIEAVGPSIEVPPGARVIDASGRWITPGFIDPHTHIGVYGIPDVPAHQDANEATKPLTPELRAADAFWPQDPTIERALSGGVTTIHVLPGSANVVGGQGVTLRLDPRLSAREMRFPDAPDSMKMACGENPKRAHGQAAKRAPSTRMSEVALLRAALDRARAYEARPGKASDLGTEALKRVVSGDLLVQYHCYRADEMLLRLEVLGEQGLRPRAFHHAVEAYKIAPQLARAGVAAVVWADWGGLKMELRDAVPAGAAILERAGVRVAFHSDLPQEVDRLNQSAALARAAGMRAGIKVSREAALRWITANPAWVLGIDDRTGTVEPGKDADLVIWSHDPLSIYARAEKVFVAGELVYDRAELREPISDLELGTWELP